MQFFYNKKIKNLSLVGKMDLFTLLGRYMIRRFTSPVVNFVMEGMKLKIDKDFKKRSKAAAFFRKCGIYVNSRQI